jgi:hypothetical protein
MRSAPARAALSFGLVHREPVPEIGIIRQQSENDRHDEGPTRAKNKP